MKRSCLLVLIAMVGMGIALTGCGSKKAQPGPAMEVGEAEAGLAPDLTPVEWHYDMAPKPPLQGSPDYRLISFGFDQESALLKAEAKGACREAVSKLVEETDARLAIIGFTDGIVEKANAISLGIRRAHATSKFLETLGITKDRMQVTSFGDDYSTARDFETIKQSRERKVEIWVVRQTE